MINGYLLAGGLLLLVAVGGVGYWRGYQHGSDHATAKQSRVWQSAINEQRARYQQKWQAAQQQARTLRQKAAKQEVEHERTTQTLRHQLATLADKHQCLAAPVPAGILRQLNAARAAAAQRVTPGTADAAVSTSSRTQHGNAHHD